MAPDINLKLLSTHELLEEIATRYGMIAMATCVDPEVQTSKSVNAASIATILETGNIEMEIHALAGPNASRMFWQPTINLMVGEMFLNGARQMMRTHSSGLKNAMGYADDSEDQSDSK